MTVLLIRLFFIFLSSIVGYYVASVWSDFNTTWGLGGALIGIAGSLIVILVERKLKRTSVRNLSAAVFGLIFGFFMAWMLTLIIRLIPMSARMYSSLNIIFILIFCYLGMVIAMKGRDEFNLIIPYVRFSRQDQRDEIILLDTSVIIDGRIADIADTNFIEGRFVIPRFVLKELQQIADSSDSLKRNRGRRGLDILNKLQKDSKINVRIDDEDFPEIKDVDAKLVKLAKLVNGKVFTNDFNLNKIAELEGVKVLNINDLTNALKPVVLPGEQMTVRISKHGKEKNQGIASLADGTMVVVENARHIIGQTVTVGVTSVLQTSAGKMIFAAKLEANHRRSKPR